LRVEGLKTGKRKPALGGSKLVVTDLARFYFSPIFETVSTFNLWMVTKHLNGVLAVLNNNSNFIGFHVSDDLRHFLHLLFAFCEDLED
jgi:hypothetical protein